MILPEPTDAFDGSGLAALLPQRTTLPRESFAVAPQPPSTAMEDTAFVATVIEERPPEPRQVPPIAPSTPQPTPASPDENQAVYEARACTAAQLRRFIKSRPYVPMHELRRRFELNGQADEVTPVDTSMGVVYVGLPSRESQFIADLVNQGDVGLELCRDPVVPIVMGVFAMRLISRQ